MLFPILVTKIVTTRELLLNLSVSMVAVTQMNNITVDHHGHLKSFNAS